MALKLFFQDGTGTNLTGYPSRGSIGVDLDLRGNVVAWSHQQLTQAAGNGATPQSGDTIAGPTVGIEMGNVASPTNTTGVIEFVSEPLSADFTIAGTITFNIWASETAMANNAGLQVVVERLDSTCAVVSTVINSEFGTELGTSTTVNNWTGVPTSTDFAKGDRIRIRICVNDVGTMAASAPGWSITTGGPTGGASGDSWIQFTEDLTFESTDPTGSTLYLTSTAASGGINPGSATDLEAWTSRGGGSTNSVTNTVAGPTSPIQITDTGGGTALEWYTRPLTAFTLAGLVKFSVRAKRSVLNFAVVRGEVALCNNDGSLVSVWAAAGAQSGPNSTTDAAYAIYPAGQDLDVAEGQRLRFRIYLDDFTQPMVGSSNDTISYNGPTSGAAGDTFVILPQTVTESSGGGALAPDITTLEQAVKRGAFYMRGWRKRRDGLIVPEPGILVPA